MELFIKTNRIVIMAKWQFKNNDSTRTLTDVKDVLSWLLFINYGRFYCMLSI